MGNEIRSAAEVMIKNGYSVIPCKKDKHPIGDWLQFKNEILPLENLNKKFNGAKRYAIVTGKISGNLENLDIDDVDCKDALVGMVKIKHKDIIDRLVFTKTPNGFGIVYRCEDEIPGNKKLAMSWEVVSGEGLYDWKGRTDLQSKKVGDEWILSGCRLETRGEGGYFLVAPSPGYETLEGSFTDLEPISKQDRDSIISIARTFDLRPDEIKNKVSNSPHLAPQLPIIKRLGDVFNEECPFGLMIEEYGWVECGTTATGVTYTRPGKRSGTSAQLHDDGMFHIYSSNCSPLEAEQQYSPFSFLATMVYDGNFKDAVKGIAAAGYRVSMSYKEVYNVLRVNVDEVENAYKYSGLEDNTVTKILMSLGLPVPPQYSLGRKTVLYSNTELNRVITEIDEGLSQVPGQWGYYEFMSNIGYVGEHKVIGASGNTEKYKGFVEYNVDSLELRVEQSILMKEKTGKPPNQNWYPARCHLHVVRKLFSFPESSAKLITGFSSHPNVLRDGTVYGLNYGYHNNVYFTHHGGFSVSEMSFKECYDALVEATCKDILFDPDCYELSQAAFIGTLLTGLIRSGFRGGCPGTMFNANEPGTGKSTAIQMISNIVLGKDSASMTWKDGQEERTKLLTSNLSTGKELVLYDNLPIATSVDDSTIAEALTAGEYLDRKLGQTKMLRIPCNSLFLFGGNNVTMSTELARRLIFINLVAPVANPANRTVNDNDILSTLRSRRVELVGYLLRMLSLGATMENKIDKPSGCGTFWDAMVRNPIMSDLGIDIIDALGTEMSASDEIELKDTAIELLKEMFNAEGKSQFTARELFNYVVSAEEESDSIVTDVKDTLTDINARAWMSTKSLGKALGIIAGRVSGTGTVIKAQRCGKKPISYVIY